MKLQRVVLTGNQAIAQGAYEAGVGVVAAYPGTPSTEITESLVLLDAGVYCEWAANEKVALEVAIGASVTGTRAMAVMKHVGLNVAADPLMSAAHIGTEGGLVIAVADDPGMHSSQNEQDSRNYARFAKVPVLEPSDSQEAKDFTAHAFAISEEFDTPVIVRSTTRISHCSSPVRVSSVKGPGRVPTFTKNARRFVPVPGFAREMRRALETRLVALKTFSSTCSLNRVIERGGELGVIVSGIAFQYVIEEFPDASILKLGLSYPFPDDLIRKFAQRCRRILVVEELDSILEEHVRSLGVEVEGREYFPGIGELTPDIVHRAREQVLSGRTVESTTGLDLPARPPVFCPGCPHRGLFLALSQIECTVAGDIGCYSLGVFPPYERLDTIVCMGAGITVAHGMDKAGLCDRPIVGVIGDSTFFHSGITGLLNLAYNRGTSTIIVLDNQITAMTGHQDHPGTGVSAMGERTIALRAEDFARACGIRRVRVVDPLQVGETLAVLKEELAQDEVSFIVSRKPCVLLEKQTGTVCQIVAEDCSGCRKCIRLGCPAIQLDKEEEKPRIDTTLCRGCTLCLQVCPQGAIKKIAHE